MNIAAAAAAVLLLIVIVFTAVATGLFTGLGGNPLCASTTPADLKADANAAGELDDEQRANAALIIQTAMRLGLPARAAVIAVATAMQESRLRNLPRGHLDSLGLFQQRPSQGWGTPEQILDPRHAARTFYRRLTAVHGWEQLPLAKAAQAVQKSAYPHAYARWETLAQHTVDTFTGSCVAVIPGERAAAVLAYAHAQLGKPYRWGAEGPAAFDCSGLTMRAYQAAGITIPRVAADQWRHGPAIPAGHEQPGDLVFFHMEPGGPGHVGIVIGNGQMIHAPNSREVVKISPYHRPDLIGFTRPLDRHPLGRVKAWVVHPG